MKKADFTLELIKDNQNLQRLVDTLRSKPAFALDIETTEWWNRGREQISLVQLAYRHELQVKVAVIDAFAALDFNLLKFSLEENSIVKIVHNAAFDAPRLAKHYEINVAPIHDTMRAARFNGERKYSLSAQAAVHLNLHLDKSVQRSEWSRRPLDTRQLYYAAVDAYATLMLYENQTNRRLTGDYYSKKPIDPRQVQLPLVDLSEMETIPTSEIQTTESSFKSEFTDVSLVLLGIVAELPTRYSPNGLAASVGSERVGLAGWIIDRRLGADTYLDEETIKLTIADLCGRQLLQTNETRRLEATAEGMELWGKFKND